MKRCEVASPEPESDPNHDPDSKSLRSLRRATEWIVILALIVFAASCGRQTGSSEHPKEREAAGANNIAPWPSASDRTEWRAEVQLGASLFGLQEAQKRLEASDDVRRRFHLEDIAKWKERGEGARLEYSRFAESKYLVVGVKRGTSALAWGLVMMSQRECFACR